MTNHGRRAAASAAPTVRVRSPQADRRREGASPSPTARTRTEAPTGAGSGKRDGRGVAPPAGVIRRTPEITSIRWSRRSSCTCSRPPAAP
jgi:hypothetical protein